MAHRIVKHVKRRPKESPKPWAVPKIWDGETAFILGGGPSLNLVNLELVHNKHIIAVNNAYGDPLGDGKYKPRDWVDICWFGDSRWWDWHSQNLEFFNGLIISCAGVAQTLDRVYWVSRSLNKMNGIDPLDGYVAWNRCSGLSAINLAYHLGVKRVVLLGFDMRSVDGQGNWHNDHKVKRSDKAYSNYLLTMADIKKDADKLGLEILNATEGSAITEFPFIDLKEILGL